MSIADLDFGGLSGYMNTLAKLGFKTVKFLFD